MGKAKLYGSASSFRTQKVLIAAKMAGVEVELAGDKPPVSLFPLEVTPALEDGEQHVFGAEAAALHLLSKLGCQKNGGSCGEQLQWLQCAEGRLLPNVLGYVLPSISAAQLDKPVVDAYRSELFAQLKRLNASLSSRTWLAGERFGIADVSVALDLLLAYKHVLDENVRKGFPNVNRWFTTVLNQPAVHSVVGKVEFAVKAAQFDEAKFAEHAKNAAPAKSETKPKAEPAKKETKKKENDAEEGDAADEALAAEPKSSDPFATMPPTSFNYDSFKRVYSNEDTDKVALPHFWKEFDSTNNSIWYCEYKFPSELTLTFMSCNLINGMYQRLEKMKKGAFGSMCLFGSDNNSTISGVWVWRGQDLIFTLSPDWQVDFESYEWKKLDPKDETTRTLVSEYFKWEGNFGGKSFNQGKVFK